VKCYESSNEFKTYAEQKEHVSILMIAVVVEDREVVAAKKFGGELKLKISRPEIFSGEIHHQRNAKNPQLRPL
jgi:hypothetical protein